jgi:hypothetical protein
MKIVKKLLSLILVTALAAVITLPAMAADASSFTYGAEAQKLNTMGLFAGTSSETFQPDLGASLTREQGFVILLKMFGQIEAADAMTDADVTAALAPYTDKDSISSWALKHVAYAVKNGIVGGTSATTIGAKDAFTGNQFATLILKEAGYSVADWKVGCADLQSKGGLTTAQSTLFAGKDLIRDDMVGIAFGSLKATNAAGKTIISDLVGDGIVDAGKAAGYNLISNEYKDAVAAVKAYVDAPLTTLSEVTAAEALGVTAVQKVALVTNAAEKADLEAQIATQREKVAAARTALTPSQGGYGYQY